MSYKIIQQYIDDTQNIQKKFVAKFLLEFCQFSENSLQYEEMLGFMLESSSVDDVIDMYELKTNEEVGIVELYYIDENKDEILMSKFTLEKYKEITEELLAKPDDTAKQETIN